MQFMLPAPFNAHCHLRDYPILQAVVSWSNYCADVLVMPNVPPIFNARDALAYRQRIVKAGARFTPHMSIKLTPKTTPEIIKTAKEAGVLAAKIYPEGVTTGSDNGFANLEELFPLLEIAENVDMPVCWHGAMPGICAEDAERAFLPFFQKCMGKFPGLRMAFEHISTKEAVDLIAECPRRIIATVTPQHMTLVRSNVMSNVLEPHNFCMPIAQREQDREAIVNFAIHDEHACLGDDSAPHTVSKKHSGKIPAGIFSAPTTMACVIGIFEKHHARKKLSAFTSSRACRHYGVQKPQRMITVSRTPWTVPPWIYVHKRDTIIPFLAGETMRWTVHCQ